MIEHSRNLEKGTMKTLKMILAAIALAFTLPMAHGADLFSGSGTADGLTNTVYIVPAHSDGVARIEFFQGIGEPATSAARFFTAGTGIKVGTAQTTTGVTSNALACVGTSLSANSYVVLQHASGDTYERLLVTASTATNVTFATGIAANTAAGDVLFKMTSAGSLTVGTATLNLNAAGSAIWNGQSGKPILVDLIGTNSPKLIISGKIIKYNNGKAE